MLSLTPEEMLLLHWQKYFIYHFFLIVLFLKEMSFVILPKIFLIMCHLINSIDILGKFPEISTSSIY